MYPMLQGFCGKKAYPLLCKASLLCVQLKTLDMEYMLFMLDLMYMTGLLRLQGVMEGVPASKDYKGGFACKLMSKDLGLAAAAAQHCGAKVPMSEEAARLYQQVKGKVPSAKC